MIQLALTELLQQIQEDEPQVYEEFLKLSGLTKVNEEVKK